MKKIHRYNFTMSEHIREVIDRNKIKYDIVDGRLCIAHIEAGSKADLVFASETGKTSIVELKYSKREIEDAEFMAIRAKNHKVKILNESKAIACQKHGHIVHETQKEIFEINKCINKGQSNLFFGNTGQFYLFCTDKFKSVVYKNGLTNFLFKDVLIDGIVSKEFFQLDSVQWIERQALDTSLCEEVIKCPECNREQYVVKGQQVWRKERIDEGNDFYRSDNMFGYINACPAYYISNRAYRVLKAEGLLSGVVFEPVALL